MNNFRSIDLNSGGRFKLVILQFETTLVLPVPRGRYWYPKVSYRYQRNDSSGTSTTAISFGLFPEALNCIRIIGHKPEVLY